MQPVDPARRGRAGKKPVESWESIQPSGELLQQYEMTPAQ
jgi:hypothetical protein